MSAASALQRLPLPEPKVRELLSLTEGLDGASLWWLSGYVAGLAQHAAPASPKDHVAASATEAARRLTVVYGSQTSNARRVAGQLAQQAERAGVDVRLLRADAYPLRELAKERLLYVVISTQGDGDPPDDARGFMDFLASRRAPRLEALSFAVLGLGDSSYPQFCVIGQKLDARFAELGASRLIDFAAADLDIDTVAGPWTRQALDSAHKTLQEPAPTNITLLRPHPEAVESPWSPTRPFAAEVLANQRITADDGCKDVRHIELGIAGAGFDYEPGDALGVVPLNPPELVDAVLDALRLDGDASVAQAGETHPLREWLSARRELTRLARPLLAALAERSRDASLQALLQQPAQAENLRGLLATRQPIDVLQEHPVEWTGEALVAALRPLAPRLYSIASSRAVVGDEVHLTVAHIAYATAAGARWGAASHWLGTRAEGELVDVYLERNERFRLPADPARDIVMIGPGTGVAPFRAFLQERAEAGARGRNWLIFGNPHFRSDFLYQVEWQAALKNGSLRRLDLAFSRDFEESPHRDVRTPAPRKTYVQHRLCANGRDLFDWLESGAHLYVCGATAMARDVEAVLREVVVEHGARTPEAADEYLASLREQRRYARDVY
ncbi:MAG: assimilatory sulfite reductase (NADPH) flavoprotein subunit [Rhodanobacteraceae bacterium]